MVSFALAVNEIYPSDCDTRHQRETPSSKRVFLQARYANRVRKVGTSARMRKICMVLVTVFIFQAAVEAADKLRIGLVDLSAVYMPLPLGEKRGFFGEQGLQAEFIRIRPNAALAALVTGEIDYWTTVPLAVAGAIPGLPVKVVACYVPGSPV